MVKLINCTTSRFVEYIKEDNRNVYVWGTGVMLHICLSYIMEKSNMVDRIIGICDSNEEKIGKYVEVLSRVIKIQSPKEMMSALYMDKKAIVVIACSYFKEILETIDNNSLLEGIECCIVPMMFIENPIENTMDFEITNEDIIPKKIHYCWFGEKKLNDSHKSCINTWRKRCPEYEIVEWNDSSINNYSSPWVDKMRKEKKWALLSDYIRAYILYNNGGFYFDTDVELIKNLDQLRSIKAFGAFEKWPVVNTGGGCGSIKGFWYWKEIMRLRDEAVNTDNLALPVAGGYYDTVPLIKKGMRVDGTLQKINDFTIFPAEYFHPFDYVSKKINVTKNTYGIHRFNWSWASNDMREGELKNLDFYQRVLSRCENI